MKQESKTYRCLLMALLLFAPCLAASVWAQDEESVSGTVRQKEDGQPLPFVNISIKGTTIGTVSDLDGKFNIKIIGVR